MVPSGTVLTYQAQVTSTGYFSSPSDVVQAIIQALSQNNIAVRDQSISQDVLSTIVSPVTGNIDFQLTLTLQTNSDFNAVTDIQGIVDHAIYVDTNVFPTSTIPNVTVPGGAFSSTGQPAQAVSSASVSGIGSSLGSIFQSGVNSFALLMVGVILAVVLIVAGKSRGVLA